MLQVISEHPPPFEADPHIIEWVERMSNQKRKELLAKLTDSAYTDAREAYNSYLVAAKLEFDNDRARVRDDYL
jgi:hypothetical protein